MRLVWFDDEQAPYREPVLVELAARCDFRALFLFADEPERRMAYRPHPGYASEVLGVRRLPRVGPLRALDSYQGVPSRAMLRRVLEADVVVVLTWAQLAVVATVLAARRRRVPYVVLSESTLDSRRVAGGPVDRVRRWILGGAGAVVVPGPAARDAVLADGVAPDRVVETVNAVDHAVFAERPRALRAGRDAGGEHRFVVVGQLIARKNVAALLTAFAALDGALRLDVVGDGVEAGALRARATELGIADRVTFHGFLDERDVAAVLAETHTLVLPSTEEVYGFTAVEARTAGLQVVVSEVAGVAASLTGADGVWTVVPDVEGIRAGLEAARRAWTGWRETVPDDAGSPARTAVDLLAAAEIALRR
ncbi:glycosyltransferase [Actinomycetospora termitidis]|uniref:Glycosyltransferase n=1 Tax=Actinomycetospora termitidis TaxID=3053470 RepID=A0ABT7MCV0_9PSEU|nr:glycosyltransferase [Actinomycetospora sp. Odt1-22]MDL5157667.1 glycosyltransferase [Actinomycetospora sp. Odt1-22]